MKENNDVIGTEEVVKAAKLRKTKMSKNVKLFFKLRRYWISWRGNRRTRYLCNI